MLLIGQALTLLGQEADVVDRAQTMLLALAPGLVPCLWFQAIRQFTVGMRRPQALLQITIASVAVNAGINGPHPRHLGPAEARPARRRCGHHPGPPAVFLALYLSAKKDTVLGPLLSLNIAKADRATVRRLVQLGYPSRRPTVPRPVSSPSPP